MLGGTRDQIMNAVSNAWLDGGTLRTYRHAPNTGSRKSWAAGDATSRAVRLALWAMAGEMGYPTALSTPIWGFQDALFRSQPIRLGQRLESYTIENILFKVKYPAEFHGQTAVEAAIQLHPEVNGRWDHIERIRIETQESARRIIDKSGPLHNPADRDHCLQYMVAVGLIHGTLTAEHYEDAAASDPRIDRLRQCMQITEQSSYSRDYLDPDKRSIANAVQVFFEDGTSTQRIPIAYPLGHRRRRAEAHGELLRKFANNARTRLDEARTRTLIDLLCDRRLDETPVNELIDRTIAE
jgi:2-methylcitrate dehydratase